MDIETAGAESSESTCFPGKAGSLVKEIKGGLRKVRRGEPKIAPLVQPASGEDLIPGVETPREHAAECL